MEHTKEPWADYKDCKYLQLTKNDYSRAVKCVNALSGIEDVEGFAVEHDITSKVTHLGHTLAVLELLADKTNWIDDKWNGNFNLQASIAVAIQSTKALSLLPTNKEPSE